jgi:hypothetical protein
VTRIVEWVWASGGKSCTAACTAHNNATHCSGDKSAWDDVRWTTDGDKIDTPADKIKHLMDTGKLGINCSYLVVGKSDGYEPNTYPGLGPASGTAAF